MVARNKSKKINKNEYITFKNSKKINRYQKLAEIEKQYGGFNWEKEKWRQFKETPIFETFFKKKTLFAKYAVLYQRRINRYYEKFTNYNDLLKMYITRKNGREVFPILPNSNIITEKSLNIHTGKTKRKNIFFVNHQNVKINIERNERHKRRIYRNVFKNKFWDKGHIRGDAFESKFYEPWTGTRSKLRKLIVNLRKYETKFNRNYYMLKLKVRGFQAEFSPQYRQYLDSISKTKLDKVSSKEVRTEKDKIKQEAKDIKNLDTKIRKIFNEAITFVEKIEEKFNETYPYYGFERFKNYKIIKDEHVKILKKDYDPFADIKEPRDEVNNKINQINNNYESIIQQLMKSDNDIDIDKINSNIDDIYSTQNQNDGLYLQYHKGMKDIVEELAPNFKYIYNYDLGFPLVNIEQYKKFVGEKNENSINKRIGNKGRYIKKKEDNYKTTFHYDKFMPMFMQKQVLKSITDDETRETYKELIDNNDHKISYEFIGKYLGNQDKDFILTNNLINCMYFFKQLNNYQDLLFGSIIFLTERYYYLFDLQNYLNEISDKEKEKENEEEQIKKGVSRAYLKRLRAINYVSKENINFLLEELKFDIQYVYILYVKNFVGKMKSRIEQINNKISGGGKNYEINDNDTDEKNINELIKVLRDFGNESIDELINKGPIYQISTRLRKILKEKLNYNSDVNLHQLIKNIVGNKNYDGSAVEKSNSSSVGGGTGKSKNNSLNKEEKITTKDFYVRYVEKELDKLLRDKAEQNVVNELFMTLKGENSFQIKTKTFTNEATETAIPINQQPNKNPNKNGRIVKVTAFGGSVKKRKRTIKKKRTRKYRRK